MQSVLRSLKVLEAVAEHQPVAVGPLTRLLGLPKSTVQRSLLALGEAGWIRTLTEDSARWVLTSRALRLARSSYGEVGLREAALVPMQRLRDATDETIHLVVPDGIRCMVLIERMDSTQAVRTYHNLGSMTQLHATSTGRSVLAHLPTEMIEQVIGEGLDSYTELTMTDSEELQSELAAIRQRGYAVNIQQNRPHVCAIGAPILDLSGSPVAGICISMPESRFDENQVSRWGEMVSKTASEISAALCR